jgi:hypothetical protein
MSATDATSLTTESTREGNLFTIEYRKDRRVVPWVVNHKKHKVFKIFFFIIGFVELLSLIILVKKFFSIGRFFLILLPKYCQNHLQICSMVFQYFGSSVANNRGILKNFFIKMISVKSSTR